jgi:hypothetical protein
MAGFRRLNWPPDFCTFMLAFLHRSFQFFLMIGKERMNLAVRFVADRVNLWGKIPPRCCRVFIEHSLYLVVMFLKQRPDLLLLFRSQFQIFGKASKFLVNRLRRMDMLQLLTCRGLLCSVVLCYAGTAYSERQHHSACKDKRWMSRQL